MCLYFLVSTTEAAAQRSTVEGPPNGHDLSLALGEDFAVVSARGTCATLSPVPSVVGVDGRRLLSNSVPPQVPDGGSA
jgi:hypothetical protein